MPSSLLTEQLLLILVFRGLALDMSTGRGHLLSQLVWTPLCPHYMACSSYDHRINYCVCVKGDLLSVMRASRRASPTDYIVRP